MKYFKNIKDVNELKKTYKKLALQLHPDKGGKKEDFQEMSAEYEKVLKMILSGTMTCEQMESELKIDEQMREALNKIIHLNVTIEIVGSWVWLTGNTYPVKDEIKKCGFKFARKKSAWYWNDGTFKKYTKKTYSLDEIKNKYGSQKIESNKNFAIA